MKQHTRRLGHKVSPLSRAKIKKVAQKFRDELGIQTPYLKVVQLYDILQDAGVLEYEIVEDFHLGEAEAVTYPDKAEIQIKESIYDGACSGDGHCRFTLAHELGHLVLHRNQSPASYARGTPSKHKVYEDSEWQADEFAGALLMDERLVNKDLGRLEAAKTFGLSPQAAGYNLHKMKQ